MARRRVRLRTASFAAVLAILIGAGATTPARGGILPTGRLTSSGEMLDRLGFPKSVGGLIDEQLNIDMGPALTNLRYAFCNAQICGTSENLECVGNLYIPGFLGEILRKAEVPPPLPGAKLGWFTMAHGPTAPTDWLTANFTGGAPALSKALEDLKNSSVDANGVKLDLGFGNFAPAVRPLEKFGDGCGIPEEQKTNVTGQNPDGIENDYAKTIMKLQWQVDAIAVKNALKAGSIAQEFTINGGKQSFSFPVFPNLPPPPEKLPPLFNSSTYPSAGTGATMAANLLSALGIGSVNPDAVSKALGLGAGSPYNVSSVLNSLASSFMGTQQLSGLLSGTGLQSPSAVFGATTLAELASSLAVRQPVSSLAGQLTGATPVRAAAVVSWGASGTTAAGSAVITDYSAVNDSFTVINALGQQRAVAFDTLSHVIANYGQVAQAVIKAIEP